MRNQKHWLPQRQFHDTLLFRPIGNSFITSARTQSINNTISNEMNWFTWRRRWWKIKNLSRSRQTMYIHRTHLRYRVSRVFWWHSLVLTMPASVYVLSFMPAKQCTHSYNLSLHPRKLKHNSGFAIGIVSSSFFPDKNQSIKPFSWLKFHTFTVIGWWK